VGKTVATIVLNWNGREFLEACLPDLKLQSYPSQRILVVDNGSGDGSQMWLRGTYPEVELIENYVNIGFAEANNIGIRRALEDSDVAYIALVNNDTRLEADWLSSLVNALQTKDRFGAVQSPLVFDDDPATINSMGIAIERSLWAFDDGCFEPSATRTEKEIFGVTGGACLFSRELVEDLMVDGSFFDPRFFSYYEDVDVAFRARHRGWRALLVPDPMVRHKGSGTGSREIHRKVFMLERNHWMYVVKNVPLRTFLSHLPHFLRKRVSRVVHWLRPPNLRLLAWSIRGNLVWMASLPYLLKARRRTIRGDRRTLEAALDLRAGAKDSEGHPPPKADVAG
jgi:GT2 family glycosyltransferase